MPLDVLGNDFWVPGSSARKDLPKFKADIFQEMFTCTEETCMLYGLRATQDLK